MGCDPRRFRRRGRRLSSRRPIVLIGLPGSGKTSVAPHAAQLLDTAWCDLDQRIVAQAGRPIADLFRAKGEPWFRDLEREFMRVALAEPPQVIAAGGGWAAEPGNLADTAGRALIIYLSITPPEAARRLASSDDRPLLAGAALEARLDELLAAREHWYRLADIEVPAGGAAPEVVAAGVATAARHYGGW